MSGNRIYYSSYLQLEKLLKAQRRRSETNGRPAHDEMTFIIVHQAYELWFKLILWELDEVRRHLSGDRVTEHLLNRAITTLGRIREIERLLTNQLDVLETMEPSGFLQFRDFLIPASGYQSVQFRLIEIKLGLRHEDRLGLDGKSYLAAFEPGDVVALERAEQEKSIADLVDTWLSGLPFVDMVDPTFFRVLATKEAGSLVGLPLVAERPRSRSESIDNVSLDEDSDPSEFRPRFSNRALKTALLLHLYQNHPSAATPVRFLAALLKVDELLVIWRYRHSIMAKRMIGARKGAQANKGVEYLFKSAASSSVFEDIAALTIDLVPSEDLPPLPIELSAAITASLQ